MQVSVSQSVEYPIDILIVTALPEERDAVLALLESPTKVQPEGLQVYYTSILATDVQEIAYRVAVTMLSQMGNVEAAHRTARLVDYLRPRAVIVVGIAGGVQGEVGLGDVVVANQVWYYEQAKRQLDVTEQRPESHRADAMLLDRAKNFLALDWHDLIRAKNPETGSKLAPHVIFGPVAVGEKVVADSAFLCQLQTMHSKLVAVEMESFGVAAAVATASSRPRFLAVRGICDYADPQKNDLWHEAAASVAAAYTIGLLRSVPISPKLEPIRGQPPATQRTATLIAIRHRSMEFFPDQAITDVLPSQFRGAQVNEIVIDQSDLYVGGRLIDPRRAAEMQMDLVGRVTTLMRECPYAELAYYGIAHIPLLFLAGYHLSNKQVLHFFEFNRQNGRWDLLQENPGGPELKLKEGVVPHQAAAAGDVVLRVSVSYEVTLEAIAGIVESPLASLHLALDEPRLDIVTNKQQLRIYSSLFRRTLDEIHNKLPNTQRVHVFYAGPVALACNFGRQISKTIHPRIVVYNYFSKGVPRYSWGLDITSDVDTDDFLVQP